MGERSIAVRVSLQKIKDFTLDLFFPRTCLGCDKERVWLCGYCRQGLHRYKNHPPCSMDKTEDRCLTCSELLPLRRLIVACNYQDTHVETAVHRLKFGYVEDMARSMGSLMYDAWMREVGEEEGLVLVPVPLHFKRHKERGFNQAELLARNLEKRGLGVVNPSTCIRQRETAPQSLLLLEQRRENISNAFSLTPSQDLRKQHLLLVDDVCTSGSTLLALSGLFHNAGVERISALVFARSQESGD